MAPSHHRDAHARSHQAQRQRGRPAQCDTSYRREDHDEQHRTDAADREGLQERSVGTRRMTIVVLHLVIRFVRGHWWDVIGGLVFERGGRSSTLRSS